MFEEFIYRFRPTKIYLENNQVKEIYEELQNQEIFLATTEENNDPMDGLQSVIFEGDTIAWQNLIKQFSLCLLETYFNLCTIGFHEFGHKSITLHAWRVFDDLETDEYKNIYNEFLDSILENENIQNLLQCLINKKSLHKNVVANLFDLYFNEFLKVLKPIEIKYCGVENLKIIDNMKENNLSVFSKICSQADGQLLQGASEISKSWKIQSELLLKFAIHNADNEANKAGFFQFISQFPIFYFDALEDMVFPKFYTASFSKTYQNSSVWGHYAEGHRGICLIFKAENDQLRLTNKRTLSLHQIKYCKSPPRIHFFRNLGKQTSNRICHWLINMNDRSNLKFSLLHKIYQKEEEFRKNYWNNFAKITSYKHTDWKYEQEIRAIYNSLMDDHKSKDERLLNYDINQLKGIAFGLRTSDELKINILKVIDEKINSGEIDKDFKFYQAYYSYFKNEIVLHEISSFSHSHFLSGNVDCDKTRKMGTI